MGYNDLSCFGGTRVETTEIDRLAREGIRFTQFYVNAPICSPSRVALTTGQYPNRWKITSYLAKREEDRKRGLADWLSLECAESRSVPVASRLPHRAYRKVAHGRATRRGRCPADH